MSVYSFLVSVSGKTAVNSCTEDGVEVCKRGFDGSWDWCDLFRLVPRAQAMDYIPMKGTLVSLKFDLM